MLRDRPSIASVLLSILTSAYILFLTNFTFWEKGTTYFSNHKIQFVALAIAFFALFIAALTSFSVKYLIKPFFIFLIMVSAAASYFVDTFGILINHHMIRDAVATTTNEAKHLITADFVFHVLLFGILPSALIVWVKVIHRPFLPKVACNCALIFPCLAVAGGLVAVNYPGYASTFREHRDFVASINPWAPIIGAVKYARNNLGEQNIKVEPLGEDAQKGPLITASRKKVLTVIVVGETARTQNFSLNGYARQTNEELATRNVISFSDVSSCGTATAVSMPCMFSVYTRAEYSHNKALSTENLTDVMRRAGIEVSWWDNNTGSKGVADRINYANLSREIDERYCQDGECNDGILVERLRRYFDEITDDTVLVMHQIGSHGPAYYLRYPAEFEKFKPACPTAQFADCTPEEITNAYDNTIVYTDHVLSQIIDLLDARSDEFATSMIYVSDHGESLGENGFYLHGLPYLFAPDVQTKVPLTAWFSEDFLKIMGLDPSCIAARKEQSYSHDNLFHSVLGVMDVKTAVYQQDLDIFAPCQAASSTEVAMNARRLPARDNRGRN